MTRILIAEDMRSVRTAFKAVATRFGEVTAVSGGEEGKKLFAEHPFDVVITDHQMRQGDGKDLAEFVLSRSPQTPVIMVTAFATKDLAVDTLNLNVFGFLEKPCPLERLEDMLSRAVAHSRKRQTTERFASFGELAQNILHEIGNPLSRILLHSEHLAKLAEQPDVGGKDFRQSIHSIEATTQKIFRIMAGVRALMEGNGDCNVTDISVQSLFHDCERQYRGDLERQDIALTLICTPPTLSFRGCASQWEQVLSNLIHNAVDALEGAATKWIRIDAVGVGPGIEMSVADSGGGIAPEIRGQIFEPLFTTKKQGNRCGLGLSIVRKIVAAHGGRIELDAHARNTRFVVLLPKATR